MARLKGGLNLTGKGLTKLRKLHKALDSIAVVKADIAAAQAVESLKLIDSGFAREQSPYGRKWKKRKVETKKTRGKRVLQGQTSRLRHRWRVISATSRGLHIRSLRHFAIAHQRPLKGRRPQRAIVPLTGRFPKKWKKPMNEAATRVIFRHFKRAGIK